MKTAGYSAKQLGKGFMRSRVNEAGQHVEILYFVKDGEVYETEEHPFSVSFMGNWSKSEKSEDWVCAEAEFIGNYNQPSL